MSLPVKQSECALTANTDEAGNNADIVDNMRAGILTAD